MDAFINNHDYVRVTDMGHITEVQYMEHWNRTCPILKLNRSEYLVKSTGEIGEFKQSETRKDNMNSLRQSFKRLSYLINANFKGVGNELWITMTYRENMTDRVQARKDFDKFFKAIQISLSENMGENTRGHLEYVKAVEPQERGAWHFHMLVKFPLMKKVYIDNDTYAKIWKHGITKVKRPDKTDNMGAYFTSYLTNVAIDCDDDGYLYTEEDEKRAEELMEAPGASPVLTDTRDQSKKVVKGGRLHMYESGMQLHNHSKGIKMPKRKDMKFKRAQKMYGFKPENLTLRKSLKIEDTENDFENVLIIEQYNSEVWNESSFLAKREFWAQHLMRAQEEEADDWRIEFFQNELDKFERKYERIRAYEEHVSAEKNGIA
ncbi:hypothetical protein MCOL2_20901 [Listeria fleischmannii FSL S10-1203]|uniref:Replication-associated protein ORF2/G2P domain-containing protein n=1 Tax=Listeria fleischmannii FSL S10-1203 TaxID=1265822 RepID=W7D3V6_9LIST|nr:hypothetical protein MCOL2_20901 [Listeria fleischmannii FSL S10-1203]